LAFFVALGLLVDDVAVVEVLAPKREERADADVMVRGTDDDVVEVVVDVVVVEAEGVARPRMGGVTILAILGAEGSVGVEGFEVEGFDHDSKKSSSFSSVLAGTALTEALMPSMCMPFGYLQGMKFHVRIS